MSINKKLTAKELKSICKGLGLNNKGNKADLIDRIEEHERRMEEEIENNYDSYNPIEESDETLERENEEIEIDSDIRNTNHERNDLLRQQDFEYTESLRQDILKSAYIKTATRNFNAMSLNEMKGLLFEKCQVYDEDETFESLLEKVKKLFAVEENKDAKHDANESEDDKQISKEELRKMRLKYFGKK